MVLVRIAEEVDMVIAVNLELTFPNKEIVSVMDVKAYLAQIRRCADSNSLRLVYKGVALSDDVNIRKWVEEHPMAVTRPHLSLWESDNGLFASAASPSAAGSQWQSPSSQQQQQLGAGAGASSSASSTFTPTAPSSSSSSASPKSSASTPTAHAHARAPLVGRLDERSLVAAADWLQRTLVPVGADTATSPPPHERAAPRSSSSSSPSASSSSSSSSSSAQTGVSVGAVGAAADVDRTRDAQQAHCRRVGRSLRHLVRSKNAYRSPASPGYGYGYSYLQSPAAADTDDAFERELQLLLQQEPRGRYLDWHMDFDAEVQRVLRGGAFVRGFDPAAAAAGGAGGAGADALRGLIPPLRQAPAAAAAAADEPVALAVHMRLLVRFLLVYWLFGQDASHLQLACMLAAGTIYYLYETRLLLRIGQQIARLFGVQVEIAGQGEQLLLVNGMILRGQDLGLFLQGRDLDQLAQRREPRVNGAGVGVGAGAGADAWGLPMPAPAAAAAAAAAQPELPREPTTAIGRLVARFKDMHREGFPVPQTPGVALDVFSLCYAFVASLAPTWDPRPVTPIRLAPAVENAPGPDAAAGAGAGRAGGGALREAGPAEERPPPVLQRA